MQRMLICLKRLQALRSNDSFCLSCWEDDNLWQDRSHRPYLDIEECIEENCVTEEEFDELYPITSINCEA